MDIFRDGIKMNATSNLVIGVIAFIAGIIMLIFPNGQYKEINANVVSVEEYNMTTDEREYRVHAEYFVDGERYEANYEGDPSIRIGDTVKLEYNVNRPASFHTAGTDILPFILMGAGVLFGIVGVFPLMKKRGGYFGE